MRFRLQNFPEALEVTLAAGSPLLDGVVGESELGLGTELRDGGSGRLKMDPSELVALVNWSFKEEGNANYCLSNLI